MAINVIADIVARSPWRRVYPIDTGGDIEVLQTALRFYLLKLGWRQHDTNSFISRVVEIRVDSLGNPYNQSVKVTWTNFLGLELHIIVSDEYDTITPLQFIRLKPTNNRCFLIGSPFQFLVMATPFDFDYCSCLVSCLNLPRFSAFLNCICAFELGSFLRNYATQDINYFLGACVNMDRTVLLNNPIGGNGDQSIISLPTYVAKVSSRYEGEFGVKSPTWLMWGDGVGSFPEIKGFLWDMFLWYDTRYGGFLNREVIDGRATLQLANNFSNILCYEYGNAS